MQKPVNFCIIFMFLAVFSLSLTGNITAQQNYYYVSNEQGNEKSVSQAAQELNTDGGGTIVIPPGEWEVDATLVFTDVPVKIVGSGMGNSIILWTSNVPNGGISFTGDMSENVGLILQDVTLKTNVVNSGNAINLIPNSFAAHGNPRIFPLFRATNCSFTGDTIYTKNDETGWNNVIKAEAPLRMVITGCYFSGRKGIYGFNEDNRAIWLAKHYSGGQERSGAENFIHNNHFNHFSVAIDNEGSEGLKITNNHLVGVYIGIRSDGLVEIPSRDVIEMPMPMIIINNNHISAWYSAVWINNMNSVNITSNVLYIHDQEYYYEAEVAVRIEDCTKVHVCNNDILNIHSSAKLSTGILFMNVISGVANSNSFYAPRHPIFGFPIGISNRFDNFIWFNDTRNCIAKMNTVVDDTGNVALINYLALTPPFNENDRRYNLMQDEIRNITITN